MGQRILRVSSEVFLSLFKSGAHSFEVVKDPLPEDVRLVGSETITYIPSYLSRIITLLLESSEWDAIPEGCVIPVIPGPTFCALNVEHPFIVPATPPSTTGHWDGI